MKIFMDTADLKSIKKAMETGLVDGVTTNPSHIAATGLPYRQVIKDICAACPGPISAEAVGETSEELVAMARDLKPLASNIVVKIPMSLEGLKVVPELEADGINCNVTMVFSSSQAWLAMKAGASYISIVLSRLDAIGNESDVLVADATEIRDIYGYQTQIIAGSLKTQNHVLSCLRSGVDIATMPPALFFQLYKHNLTDAALDQFDKDWKCVTNGS